MRTVTCVNCRAVHERSDDSTWHNNQCDDCIVRWAHEKSVKDADKAITDGAHPRTVSHLADIEAAWRSDIVKRGLR